MLLVAYAQSAGETLNSIYSHRRLLAALAKRDLSDEYVGHGLSVWPLIHPLFLMLVYVACFTWIFPTRVQGRVGFDTDATVYLLSGIVPWLLITQVMSRSVMSVVGNNTIVKQMAFPLELLPVKTLATPCLFGAISVIFVVCYAAWRSGGGVLLTYLWGIPLLVVLSGLLLTGLALLMASLQVFTRDLREVVLLFITAGLFVHPILYSPNAIPAVVRPLLYLSPFSYFLFCWQDIFFFGGIERVWAWAVTAAFATLVFVVGARIFMGSKPYFGDFL